MSDRSQGDGWWQGSDNRWYPPQGAALPPPPSPPPGSNAFARGWRRFRGLRLWLQVLIWCVVGFFAIGIIGAIAGVEPDEEARTSSEDTTTTDRPSTTEEVATTTTAPPTTAPPTTAPPTTTTVAPSTTASPPPPPSAVPDVVGLDLQLAQDTMQAAGYFVLDDQDASGLDRFQVLDSNWMVCSQSPQAGAPAPPETEIVLYAVKNEETCP